MVVRKQRLPLPIDQFEREIIGKVAASRVTIIEAETGAGKSTRVPQMLHAAGYEVIVTQPRVLAARTVSKRVAEEMGVRFGDLVGYKTSRERKCSRSTEVLFCTDGLALVKTLLGHTRPGSKPLALVLDEVHEWNENMEVLVAWIRKQIDEGNLNCKLIIMSATMQTAELSHYFDGAPIISVPGRLFPIQEKEPGRNIIDDVVMLLKQGRNVLVFMPGKGEIASMIKDLESIPGLNAEIMPLHGELTPEEQQRCFQRHSRPICVVATNVAQTSVTIPNIDAVIDSGMEKRIELRDGVEGLYLCAISRADSQQRKGRAGRTRPGIYIDHCPEYDRLDFPTAEIMRRRLDQTYLRLAIAGYDMEELRFFHQPRTKDIRDAHRLLIALGCMTARGTITPIGYEVNRLPISVKGARMVVEAKRLGVVDDVLTIVAILEQGGILDRKSEAWRKLCQGENTSDLLAQLAVFEYARRAKMPAKQMPEHGIMKRAYFRVRDTRKHISDALRGQVEMQSSGNRDDILRAVCAGMVDHVYTRGFRGWTNGDLVSRQLANSSVVPNRAKLIVGDPFDFDVGEGWNKRTIRLVTMASVVTPQMLADVAPHLVSKETGLYPFWSEPDQQVVATTIFSFYGQVIAEVTEPCPDHPEAGRLRPVAFQPPRILARPAHAEGSAESGNDSVEPMPPVNDEKKPSAKTTLTEEDFAKGLAALRAAWR